MTVQEFKDTYPEKADLEGDELLDAMTMAFINQERGHDIIKTTFPFWKRYKLRYLFYIQKPNTLISKEWQSDTVCKNCKRGTSMYLMFMGKAICMCGEEIIKVPNKSLKYLLWKHSKPLIKFFWDILRVSHLINYSNDSRYGLFGDEAQYRYTTYNFETGVIKHFKKPRKWFEYIFIKI